MKVDTNKAEPNEAVGKLLGYSVSANVNPFSGGKYWTSYLWRTGNNAPEIVNGLVSTEELAIAIGWEYLGAELLRGEGHYE